jgi:hypothetical protein
VFPAPEPGAEWNRRPGSTRLGGSDGFVGIIDEFGVYFRDAAGEPAVYSDMYRDARRRELGSTLVYAEGFDSGALPENSTARGRVRSEQGVLILGEGARLTLPPLPLDGDVLVAEIESANVAGDRPLTVRVAGEDGALFSIDATGAFEGRAGASQLLSPGSPLRFRLRRAEGGLRVTVGGDSFTVPRRAGDADPDGTDGGGAPAAPPPDIGAANGLREVEVRLLGPTEPGVSRVESVLVYREAERVAAGAAGEGATGAAAGAAGEGPLP